MPTLQISGVAKRTNMIFLSITFVIIYLPHQSGQSCEYRFSSASSMMGEFTSVAFPHHYPTNTVCRYIFQGTIDERIRIKFQEFDLENGTNAGCGFDFVDVFTIDENRNQNLERRLCGSRIPAPIITVHATLELRFKSDYKQDGSKGFKGTYEFIDERWQPFAPSDPACGPDYITGVGGEISSPGYPHTYISHINCTWMIRVEHGQRIILNFIELNLGQSVSCKENFVEIYNGFASPTETPEEKICGQLYFYDRGVKEAQSTAHRVVLRYYALQQLSANSGFRVVWTAVHLPWKQKKDETGKMTMVEERCEEFTCKGGEYCIDTTGMLCNPLPQYCIANSLRCNSVPNCGVYDHSDEAGCLRQLILVLSASASSLFVVIVVSVIVLVCRARCRRRQERARKMAGQMGAGLAVASRSEKNRSGGKNSRSEPSPKLLKRSHSLKSYSHSSTPMLTTYGARLSEYYEDHSPRISPLGSPCVRSCGRSPIHRLPADTIQHNTLPYHMIMAHELLHSHSVTV